MQTLNLTQQLAAAAAAGAGAWHLLRPVVQPYIDKGVSAVPAWLAGRARDRFAAAVASGKLPPAAVRLFKALGAATIAWAKAELGPDADTAAQAALAVSAASHVPYLDKLVAADPDDAAHDVTLALTALKAELAKDATPPA